MSKLKLVIARALAMVVLLAPMAVAQAAEQAFAVSGPVLQMTRKSINVGDMQFNMSPTVKVVIPGKKKAGLSDLKRGDHVGIKMIEYRGKTYVDTIVYLPGGLQANE